MINAINILLSNKSVPFCHYNLNINDNEKWIDEKLLAECFNYSKKNNININLIYPPSKLPDNIKKILDGQNFITTKYLNENDYGDINVLHVSEIRTLNLTKCKNKIFILLINKNEIHMISDCLTIMKNKFKKISFMLTDIELWNDFDIENYKKELYKCFDILIDLYVNVKNNFPEINIITDKWFLKKENSCNAGISHYTLAPDGNVYLCPAFYLTNQENIGTINNIKIKNQQLLKFENAPICRECDSFHCNRCIYLNKITTNELNTPSYQQCEISHVEREISRVLLNKLKKLNKLYMQIHEIPEISYSDPLKKIVDR